MVYQLGDRCLELRGKNHFIAPNASVIGSVVLEEGASVWFGVVIRGDSDQITIGENSNIQDGAVLHVDPGYPLIVGRGVSVGHKAMLHGCKIGDNSLIGINAVVLNGAVIGKNCIIGANTLITENMIVPDGSMVVGSPGKIKRQLSEDQQASMVWVSDHYVENASLYTQQLQVDENYG
jgi:carbonic anhydrase/acetyltransferase-like protein (isoleucine patch superfamily)